MRTNPPNHPFLGMDLLDGWTDSTRSTALSLVYQIGKAEDSLLEVGFCLAMESSQLAM